MRFLLSILRRDVAGDDPTWSLWPLHCVTSVPFYVIAVRELILLLVIRLIVQFLTCLSMFKELRSSSSVVRRGCHA
jgi:hypothetical protein